MDRYEKLSLYKDLSCDITIFVIDSSSFVAIFFSLYFFFLYKTYKLLTFWIIFLKDNLISFINTCLSTNKAYS